MKQAGSVLFCLLLVTPFALTSTESLTNADTTISKNRTTDSNPSSFTSQSLYQIMAAEMALDRDHPEAALSNYIAAAKETQDPAIASRATQIALTVGSLEEAIEPAVIWAQHAQNDLEAQITTAALYLRLHTPQKAIPYLRHTETLNTQEAFQYFLILFKQLQDDDNKMVVQALQELAQDSNNSLAAKWALTEIYFAQNKPNEALAISERALALSPRSAVGIQLHSEALLRTKGIDAAKEYLKQVMPTEQNNVLLQHYYAQFLYDNNDKKAARHVIEGLVKNKELSAEELLQLARLCIQAQWYDLSKSLLLRAEKYDENKDLSLYFLARVAEMQNKDNEAIEWFKKVSAGPFYVLSQIRASTLLAEKKQYDEAIAVLTQVHSNDPAESKQVILALTDVYNQANQFQNSLDYLDSALSNYPDDLDFRYARSLVADKMNNTDLAEKDLKSILSVQPNHIEALNALGYILITHTQRYSEAQTYLKQALKLSPNNPSVLDSLGWLYYKMGDYKQSVELLQKAQDIKPDPEIAAHLGEVLWQLKDYEGAKRVWNQALQQYPKHENVTNVMKRLMTKKPEN